MLRQIVLRDATAGEWLIFAEPLEVVSASDPSAVVSVLEEVERRVREEDLYAAGFVSYEAASAFDAAFTTRPASRLPLVSFGLFRPPERRSQLAASGRTSAHESGARQSCVWNFDLPREKYLQNVARIRREIAAGNTYQVNYTVRQRAEGIVDAGDAWELFLHTSADAPYAACIDLTDHAIVSASPELFFALDGDRITCKPMKGTAPRGMTQEQDSRNRRALRASAKDRAENVMIADMVRNDLGRIAVPGSVVAAPLFEIEKYRTVWQMTSTVSACTSASLTGIFRALFPSASVTGAPKVSSMKFIAALEDSPRQVYTGAIGYIAPERRALFNVAIRTALIDKRTGVGTYGVGGGIVWDSDAENEYEECRNKARVLGISLPERDFRLLETLLWSPGEGYFLLNEHLERIAASADYFDFHFERNDAGESLAALAETLADHDHRIRLLLQRNGEMQIEAQALARDSRPEMRLALAGVPIDSGNPFLYHKTTQRDAYAQALSTAVDCDDVLLWNADGYVTETTIGNIVARIDGNLVTPPIECGLLAGTFRRSLLRQGVIAERQIRVAEVTGAEAIFMINSVRGWVRCRLQERDAATKRSTCT